jgi:hypothetical protein
MVVFRVGVVRFWNWITAGVLLSPWRRLLLELLFSYLFRSVVKDFWDEICFRFWNICEETSGIFSEFSEMEKVVVHGSEELLHSCCAGEVYCNTTATVFRSVQGSYVWNFSEVISSMSGSLGKNFRISEAGKGRVSFSFLPPCLLFYPFSFSFSFSFLAVIPFLIKIISCKFLR